MIILRICCWRF